MFFHFSSENSFLVSENLQLKVDLSTASAKIYDLTQKIEKINEVNANLRQSVSQLKRNGRLLQKKLNLLQVGRVDQAEANGKVDLHTILAKTQQSIVYAMLHAIQLAIQRLKGSISLF